MARDERQELIQKNKEIITTSYEQARSHANIIIMGGYAGLFAIWNFTKSDLELWQSMSVGLLALISVLIFVLFELYSIWFRQNQTSKLLSQLEEAEKLDKFTVDYKKQEIKRVKKFIKVWLYFFFSALGTGLLAALILAYSFAAKLISN
ncbi:MAG: hypothetical protein ACLP29_15960 [Dissulfurispiraceae bacterium]|jgi:hypothetical protein